MASSYSNNNMMQNGYNMQQQQMASSYPNNNIQPMDSYNMQQINNMQPVKSYGNQQNNMILNNQQNNDNDLNLPQIETNMNNNNDDKDLEDIETPIKETAGFQTPVGVVDTLSMIIHQKSEANKLGAIDAENEENDDDAIIDEINQEIGQTPGNPMEVGQDLPAPPTPITFNAENADNIPPHIGVTVNKEQYEEYEEEEDENQENEDTDSYEMFTPLPEDGDSPYK